MRWAKVKLGDYVTIVGGGTPDRSNPIYWGDEIPWATVKDLSESKYLNTTEEGITQIGFSKSATNIVEAGTVITATRIGLGKVTIASTELAINQDLKALYCKPDLHPEFLYYFLLLNAPKIQSLGKGATVKGITLRDLNDLAFVLPPLEEQKRIAQVLDKADRLRQKDRQLLQYYDQLQQSVFLDMFGDPVKNEKGWEKVEFKNVLHKIQSGWSPVCQNNTRTDHKQMAVLKLGAVSGRYFKSNENKQLPETIKLENQRIIEVKNGDLLFVRKNTSELVGACAFVYNPEPNLLLPDTIFKLDYNNKLVEGSYLWFLINHTGFRKKVQLLASGSAGSMPNISAGKLNGLEVPIPDKELQVKFDSICSSLQKQKNRLEQSIRTSEILFQSLIQKAFKGELQLKGVKAVEESLV